MATVSDIAWGKYREYEGAFYRGKNPYKLPAEPNDNDKIIAVITATEGGKYDAYNGYDRCISTSGLIQWCEAGQYSVSDMLGKASEHNPLLLRPITDQARRASYLFQKNTKGRWRFFRVGNVHNEVDTLQEQQQLFLLDSSGKIGTWDDTSRKYAKEWAAAVSTVWEDPTAQELQAEYTAKRLRGFALPYASKLLSASPGDAVGRAFVAAYLSFAANNPTWANRHLQKVAEDGKYEMWTSDWLVHVLKELTFGPKVVIYPHRYNAIRPVLEKLYGLNLPDFAKELDTWKQEQPHGFFYDTLEIQKALITLGYDLGPHGADGAYGNKTREAVLLFEQMDFGEQHKVPLENVDGMVDEWTARKLEEVLEKRGVELLAP
jgi:hypothetical protein